MIWSVQKQPPVEFCKKSVLNIFASFTGKHLWHLGLQLYSKETPTQAFSGEICKNFRNTYFEEHLWTTASECYYNGGKILRNTSTSNTSTSCKDCFLGTVKSDRKRKIFFYLLVWKFHTMWLWMVLGSCCWFWLVLAVFGSFGSFWVVVGGFGWF